MREDKVEVIISQERYDELLQKEKDLSQLQRDKKLYMNLTFLDTRSTTNVLREGADKMSFKYEVGDEFPDEAKEFIKEKAELVREEMEKLNQYRLDKLDNLMEALKEEFKVYDRLPKQKKYISWFRKIIFLVKMWRKDA